MKTFLLRVVIIFCLMFSAISCQNKEIIAKRDMVKILTKVYLTDGTVNNLDKRKFANKDTIQYYEPIFQSYGYTVAQFDSSIKYYSQNLEKFDEILDGVIIELTKIEAQYTDMPAEELEAETKSTADTTQSEWPHKTYWNMAVDSKENPHLGFDVLLKGTGKYELTYDAYIFEDDSVVEPYFKAYLHYGTTEAVMGEISGVQTLYYQKDSVKHSHSFTFEVTDSLLTILKGYLYLYNTQLTDKNCFKHAIFSNIFVRYTPATIEPAPAVKPKPDKPERNPKSNIKIKKEVSLQKSNKEA